VNANAPGLVDAATVRAHLELVHDHAARALNGADRPGFLQLDRIHPAGGPAVSTRFAVGDVDRMVEAAIDDAGAGFNVYIETRTVAQGTRKRGGVTDTHAVFGLVVDSDADKDKAATLPIEPSAIIESSPGNFHYWFLLERAIKADEAKPIGEAIKAGTGGDSNTGVITQPYRVAGTPNYPGPNKIKRGRTVEPTKIIKSEGPTYTADQLRAAFPPIAKDEGPQQRDETTRTGAHSEEVEALVAERNVEKRGRQLFKAVRAAIAAGLGRDDLDELMRQHPEGCASKFLKPDRLRKELDRAWDKALKTAGLKPAEPTYPLGDILSVSAGRVVLVTAINTFIDDAEAHHREVNEAPSSNLGFDFNVKPAAPVYAIKASTGIGKTRKLARLIAYIRKHGPKDSPLVTQPWLILVPTHRLSDELVPEYARHGLRARVWRGRKALNPHRPQEKMCLDLEAVEIAQNLGESAERTVCKGKDPKGRKVQCRHYSTCAYQAQKDAGPDVWIAANNMLFHEQAAFGKVCAVIIDEAFWRRGIREPANITLNEFRAEPFDPKRIHACADLAGYRSRLAAAIDRQEGKAGGIRREHLIAGGITPEMCTDALGLEWDFKRPADLAQHAPRSPPRGREGCGGHAPYQETGRRLEGRQALPAL
jgi:hypothetical protein